MIKIESIVTPSVDQLKFAIQGMRNAKNSWDKSDTEYYPFDAKEGEYSEAVVGYNDAKLMKILKNAGTDHRKYLRQLPIGMRITAPLYWWKEFDTYKVGTTSNSCSTMHKIDSRHLDLDDFSHDKIFTKDGEQLLNNIIIHINQIMDEYKKTCDKRYWDEIIQILPSNYNQTRNVTFNYEVIFNILRSRETHKLSEWREFCDTCKTLPLMSILLYD